MAAEMTERRPGLQLKSFHTAFLLLPSHMATVLIPRLLQEQEAALSGSLLSSLEESLPSQGHSGGKKERAWETLGRGFWSQKPVG